MALVPDQKFSTFNNGGDLEVDDIIVGLRGGLNTRFTYTGELPPGVVVPIAQGGTGATTASGARTNLGLGTMAVQNSTAVAITGGTLSGVAITASTAALTAGSVVAAPVAGIDLVNKTYADSLVVGTVTSVSGTLNRITSTGGTTPVIDISAAYVGQTSITTLGTISTGVWQGTLVSPIYGGTGVNNGASTLTLGGSLTTVGAFASTFTMTGVTGVTFPTSGTLATTSQLPTPAALTRVDDTNVTVTLGGTPATALLQAVSLTMGWSGLLAVARGGTGVGSVTTAPTATAFAGWDANLNLSANNFLARFTSTVSAAGTTVLTVASTYNQEITGATTQTFTLPVTSTLTAGHSFFFINNSSGNVTINSSGGNAVLVMAANTTAAVTCVLASGTTAASWNSSYVFDAGAGVLSITGTANQVIASASTGNVTLSLPQSIATTSAVQFNSVRFNTANGILDSNGNTILTLTASATAVNNVEIRNSAAGATLGINAIGSDANISLVLNAKGANPVAITGAVGGTQPFVVYNGTALQHSTLMTFANTAAARAVTWPDSDGTVQFAAGSGGLKSFQTFTSGTAQTYTRPAGITKILVECWGGGGGGGGVDAVSSSIGAAGGGAGGSYSRKWYSSAASSYTYTVGGGGNGGTAGANNGSTGTATTFDTISATGGNGGTGVLALNAACVVALGGVAQVATGGDINTSGFAGHMGVAGLGSAASGAGGSSALGGGAVGIYNATLTTSTAGANATAYGGGGSGAVSFTGTVDRAGGNGSVGLITVWEFA